MFWTKEECIAWLPFVQAVAEGKHIGVWTGCMASTEGKDPALFTDNELHRFVDTNGVLFASKKDEEWHDNGNILPLSHPNRVSITHPELYIKILE